MGWDWSHLKGESWWTHTKRSAKISSLLLISGLTMLIHMIIPLWQQPKWLRGDAVVKRLCELLEQDREMTRIIVRLVYFLTILIIFDLTATLFWINKGLATEANPIMDFFLEYSPLMFVLAKLGLSTAGIYILYFFRKKFKRKVFNVLLALNVIYLLVFVYHLWGALFLIFSTI